MVAELFVLLSLEFALHRLGHLLDVIWLRQLLNLRLVKVEAPN